MERRENQIAPRLRPGEAIPEMGEGLVPTRVDGEIIGVPAKTEFDVMRGNSPYTVRQIEAIEARRAAKRMIKLPHEGTLFELFFPDETPEITSQGTTFELRQPEKDY